MPLRALPALAAIAGLALAASPTLAGPRPGGAAAAATVKAPKSGAYPGRTAQRRPLTLYISGKSVEQIAFQFSCGKTAGNTVLNDIKLTKSKKGYKFSITAFGSITYSDEKDPENAKIDVSGRFSRTGRRAVGQFRVKSSRCGGTGHVKWSAKRWVAGGPSRAPGRVRTPTPS
jgi:hypothetical protein